MPRTYVAGAVVVGPNAKILVVNQNGDSWSLPKGHIEVEEDAKEAAVREIYEESGVSNVSILFKLGEYERPKIKLGGIGDDFDELKHITIFLAKTDQSELRPIDPSNPEAKWVEIDEVEILLSHPKDKEFFRSIKSKVLKHLAS